MQADAGSDAAGWKGTDQDGSGHGLGGGFRAGEDSRMRKLAQDWITLWQSELTALAADPELRESWQAMTALWAGTMAATLRGIPREEPYSAHERPHRRAGAADAPRPPTPAAAPDSRDVEIERLARHVAALERRLAELERGSDPAGHPQRRP